MRCDVFEVGFERGELSLGGEVDRGCGDDRVVVVYELRQRVLDVSRPAPEHAVRILHLLGQRRVVENGHDAPADDAAEKVVQILDGGCAPPPFALFDRETRRRDVLDVIEQPEQPVDAIERPAQFVLEGTTEQRFGGVERVAQQVVLQRQAVVVAGRFPDDDLLQGLTRA